MEHLNENFQKFILDSSNEERINYIKKGGWIGYTLANKIIDRFEYLKTHPTIPRMPNALLIGDSNNGKTSILNKYRDHNQAFIDSSTGELIAPVIYILTPNEPNEKALYMNILDSLNAPYNVSERLENRRMRIIHLIRKLQVKLIMIDEIHSAMAGSITKQRAFFNNIKYLSNVLQISMVCCGTKEALYAINTDVQLMNRFPPIYLKQWIGDEEYFRLLASFQMIIPLKKKFSLLGKDIALKILSMSEGYIGEISEIIKLSSIYAIRSSEEIINLETLKKIDYVSPSTRRNN